MKQNLSPRLTKLKIKNKIKSLISRFIYISKFYNSNHMNGSIYPGIIITDGIGIKEIDGHKIYFDPEDKFLLNTLVHYESSERFVTELIKKFLKRGMNGINIGANVGYYTLLMARQVGHEGRIFSFEPFLHTVKILRRTVEENGYKNIEIIQKAVSNKTGKEKILVTPSAMHNIITPLENPELHKIIIDTTTIDDFLNDKKLKIDFIMMDAEGSEPRILEGMKNTIVDNPEMDIITEYNAFPLRIAGVGGEAFLDKILQLGFSIFNIDDPIQKVLPITKEEVLKRYPDEDMKTRLTNLYLTRNPSKFT